MRRFILLLLLAITVFQPAFSGMPKLAASSASMQSAEMSGSSSSLQESTGHASACFSHVEASGPDAPAGCSSGQPCGLCNVCQACHQAVMVEDHMPSPAHTVIRLSFPSVASGYFSAERAQSFKPPIL